MNKIIMLAIIIALVVMQPIAASAAGSHTTKGYTKKNGTYVARSRATNPDRTKRNNYSTKGNVNPSSGKPGTKNPDK